jgi:hypothetical protein
MIQNYIKKLIENLPSNITKREKIIKLDIILDGGIFNGSYLIGCLYFLKEMERRKFIKIERISGCSIGSIMAFLYFCDALDIAEELYIIIKESFTKTHNISIIQNLYQLLKHRIPENIVSIVNNRLYVTYYNVKTHRKIIKSHYTNSKKIVDILIRSSFVPFLINGKLVYKNKYIDGITPHIFIPNKFTKILYLDLFGYDKINNLINVKNEKNNFHRILSGLLDIHTFYIKQVNTQICSYVEEWTIINKLHNFTKGFLENIFIYIIYFISYLKKYFPCKHPIYKFISKIIYEIYVFYIENYCF